jgi:hypothetical protein
MTLWLLLLGISTAWASGMVEGEREGWRMQDRFLGFRFRLPDTPLQTEAVVTEVARIYVRRKCVVFIHEYARLISTAVLGGFK